MKKNSGNFWRTARSFELSILKSKSHFDKREPTTKTDKKRTKRVHIVEPLSDKHKPSKKNVTRKV